MARPSGVFCYNITEASDAPLGALETTPLLTLNPHPTHKTMECKPTGISPSGIPDCTLSTSTLLKFAMLGEERAQVDSTMGANRNPNTLLDDKALKSMCLPKLRRPSVYSANSCPTSIASTFFASHASPSNNPCIIDPLQVFNKSPLTSALPRKRSQQEINSNDSCCLEEALRNFDKEGWVDPLPQHRDVVCTPVALQPTRTGSSSCFSNFDDYDEHYLDVSDSELEIDHDGDVYPEPDHYVTDAKAKDSLLDILYEDRLYKKRIAKKRPRRVDTSKVSTQMESGYRSTTKNTNVSQVMRTQSMGKLGDAGRSTPVVRCVELVSSTPVHAGTSVVKTCISDVYPICVPQRPTPTGGTDTVALRTGEDSTEQISKLIVDLIGPNSRVGKLIFKSCTAGQSMDCIYEEIKQCVQAELQMEDKLANFFRKSAPPVDQDVSVSKSDSLRRIDDTLVFVKEHLSLIRADINEFKENSYQRIDSKVSYTEFADTTEILRAKMTYLERKLFNEHRIMRQDIRNFREKVNFLENEAACGLKNFPVWPFLAFIGAYSLVNFGRR